MKNYFFGKVINGEFSCKEWYNWLGKYEGKQIEVFAEPVTNKRSEQQNRLWFGLIVSEVANTTGYTKDEVHDFLARKFLGTRDIIIGKDKITVRRSTTELNKNDFSELIEQAKLWAAEQLNITINLSLENEEMYKM